MKPMSLFVIVASTALFAVACGGAVEQRAVGGGGTDGDGSPIGGGRAEGVERSAPGALVCSDSLSTPVMACAEPSYRSNTELSLTVQDNSCFSGSCSGPTEGLCVATVDGNTITIEHSVHSCWVPVADDSPRACTSDCRSVTTDCKLPALAPGEYHVVGKRDPWDRAADVLDTTLVVKDEATLSACPDPTALKNH